MILFVVLAIPAMIMQLTSGKACPACDNGTAKTALAKLYDNRRLLLAADVSGLRLIRDGLKGRYCTATVSGATDHRPRCITSLIARVARTGIF